MRRPGSEDPHRRERKFLGIFPLVVIRVGTLLAFNPEGIVVGF